MEKIELEIADMNDVVDFLWHNRGRDSLQNLVKVLEKVIETLVIEGEVTIRLKK